MLRTDIEQGIYTNYHTIAFPPPQSHQTFSLPVVESCSFLCFSDILKSTYNDLRGVSLGHAVQRTPVLEPLNLTLVESMGELAVPGVAVLRVDSHCDWLTHSQFCAQNVDLVIGVDLVVVGGIRECQGQHTLLLEVRFVLSVVSHVRMRILGDLRYERRIW